MNRSQDHKDIWTLDRHIQYTVHSEMTGIYIAEQIDRFSCAVAIVLGTSERSGTQPMTYRSLRLFTLDNLRSITFNIGVLKMI